MFRRIRAAGRGSRSSSALMASHASSMDYSSSKDSGLKALRGSNRSKASSGSTTKTKFGDQKKKKMRITRMRMARALFIICLCLVAVCLSLVAFLFLTESETELAERQFISITTPALKATRSRHLAQCCATWFHDIASNVMDASSTDLMGSMGFLPIVYPETRSSFEDFAYNYLEENFPAGTGYSPEGVRGIYSRDFVRQYQAGEEQSPHYTTNSSNWGSPNHMYTPYLQVMGPGSDRVLMFNLHSLPSRGVIFDTVLACTKQRSSSLNHNTSCSSISDALFVSQESEAYHLGPGAVFVDPIYPAEDKGVVTGFVTSMLNWIDVLKNVVPEGTTGIDCVLATRNGHFTYKIKKGGPVFVGEGDLHDHAYTRFRGSIPLTDSTHFASSSAAYTMTFYPSEEFFESYSTRNPLFATVGAVCIIVFTSLAFLLYDALVRQEFHNKQAIMEAKRKFVRFVSHEVRTPLNSVVMGLKLMQEDVESMNSDNNVNHGSHSSLVSNEDRSEMISYVIRLSQQILDSAENAVTVLSDLLNYDKIEMGQLSLEPTILSIWDLIQSCSEEFRLPFQAKNINFLIDYSGVGSADMESGSAKIMNAQSLPYKMKEQRFVGDSIRITQVLRNLISNAMKFTPENGQVTVRASFTDDPNKKPHLDDFQLNNLPGTVSFRRSGTLKLTVTDTGAGMSPDQVQKLFQSGVQFNVNQLQAGKGSGLGLFIAKGIVEQHGGTLTASSEGLGQGTTFTMTLPLHYIPDQELPESMGRLLLGNPDCEVHDHASTRSATQTFGEETLRDYSLRVLVVDDAVMNRKLLSRLLEKRGYTCDQAEDGQQAVDMVTQAIQENNPYDTILMDFEMPVLNGPLAAKKIREMGCDPFIAGITGNVLPEDVAYFKENGANWVFPKPVRIPDLEAVWLEYGVIGGREIAVEQLPESPLPKVLLR